MTAAVTVPTRTALGRRDVARYRYTALSTGPITPAGSP